jgi:putative aldouronate transport system substrate-binding protein
MLKRKKIIVICIAIVTTISVFAGCTKAKVDKTTADNTNGPKPTLKALMRYMKDDYNTYPVAKSLEEKTGYKVQYDMLPQDKSEDKLNLIIASGEEYDFINVYNKDRYTDYAQQGALAELEELINKYGPNIKKNIEAASFDGVRVGGKVYAIPTTSVSSTGKGTIGTLLAVRQDWLDKLGLKLPTTVDELTDILQQFKDKDPGSNGAKNIPLTTGQVPNLDGLGGAFGITHYWNDVKGELVPNVLMPGYKDYLSYMTMLYQKELLDKEFPTNQGATTNEKFTSGRAGVMPLHWANVPTIMDALKKNKPEAKISFIQPLDGKYGKGKISVPDFTYKYDGLTMIPKASKNKEHTIKYINAVLEEETFKEFVIGKENEHYTVKDGGYYPILPKFFDERGNANNYLTGITKNYGKYWLARLRKDDRLYDAYNVMNVKYDKFFEVEPTAAAPVMPENSKNGPVLNQLKDDFTVKVIVGATPISGYDNFAKDWKAKGGDANIKEMNTWYKTVKK